MPPRFAVGANKNGMPLPAVSPASRPPSQLPRIGPPAVAAASSSSDDQGSSSQHEQQQQQQQQSPEPQQQVPPLLERNPSVLSGSSMPACKLWMADSSASGGGVGDPRKLDAYMRQYSRLAQSKISSHFDKSEELRLARERLAEEEQQAQTHGGTQREVARRRQAALGGRRSLSQRACHAWRWLLSLCCGAPSAAWDVHEPEEEGGDASTTALMLHERTWGATVERAFAEQAGSESNYLMRVEALMLEPKIVAAFAQFDENGDGVVPTRDIETVLRDAGSDLTGDDMTMLLAKLDINGDGVCDLWELCCFLVSRHDEILHERNEREIIDMALSILPVNAAGMVPTAELRRIFCKRNRVELLGLDDAGFSRLVAECGGTEDGVPHAALKQHAAFQPQKRSVGAFDAALGGTLDRFRQ